jgi:hypothetical protein
MRNFILNTAVCAALALGGANGCRADIHDNTADVHDNNANIDNAEVTMESTSDMDNVTAGETVHLDIQAQDVFLVDPSETPTSDRIKVAGHFEIFLDSTSSTALMVTAEKSVDVMIPASTSTGKHKLLCRVDKHDGTATKAVTELELTVVAKVSGSVDSST